MAERFEIRTMSRAEFDFAVEQAAREGWNPGLHDGDAFYSADPQGFLGGWLDGRPIGCISAVSYGGTFGFIGFYIVVPEFRGQGYGIRLWQAAMQRLAGHNIGLDGVVEQQTNYRKSGFKLAYSNLRFERTGPVAENTAQDLVDARTLPFEQLAAYDRAFFPTERQAFLQAWLRMPASRCLAALDGQRLQGYGVVRPCRSGFKIGPLFADHESVADQLYRGLAAVAGPDAPVYLDVPEVNPAALALAVRYGMRKVFGTARMYTGAEPPLALDRLYGVTTFELG
jgi:GNAT superfamily N-acetyltransferase